MERTEDTYAIFALGRHTRGTDYSVGIIGRQRTAPQKFMSATAPGFGSPPQEKTAILAAGVAAWAARFC